MGAQIGLLHERKWQIVSNRAGPLRDRMASNFAAEEKEKKNQAGFKRVGHLLGLWNKSWKCTAVTHLDKYLNSLPEGLDARGW